MNKIPLMNLARQYQSLKPQIDKTVLDVLASGRYIMGPSVKAFEQEFAAYIGVKYAISVANGTDALEIALKSCQVKQSDEVITCGMSVFATSEAISAVGATPVFVDCCNDTYILDTDKIEEKITEKTKAIVVVHLYGQCADMDKLNEIAHKHNLKVVEDAAHAAGATYKGKRAGSLGDIGCVSLFPTKNLGCDGDGGIITTNDEQLARMCKAYRVNGGGLDGKFTYNMINGITDDEENIDFGKNLPKYFNFVVGRNSRLDEIQAAILRVKLPHLDKWNKRRREIAEYYNEHITNPLFIKPFVDKNCEHIYYVYVLKTKYRDEFRDYMEQSSIATGVYFPVPLHLQVVYEDLGYKPGDLPNVENLAAEGVAIPMFPELTEEELQKIVTVINNFRK